MVQPMSMILQNSHTHNDDAVTLQGLARVLRSMRWQDIETFVDALDEYRRQNRNFDPQESSRNRLSANDIQSWLQWMEDEG